MDPGRTDLLLRSFRRAARDLPSRRRTACRALEAFLKRFPTTAALAGADEQAVLAVWQRLGSWRRARHLHAAPRMIVDDFNGRVPRTMGDLLRLPGGGAGW